MNNAQEKKQDFLNDPVSEVPNDQRSTQGAAYVLVTPVRNEEKFIGRTIKSVLNQTILPREWVIVSDGSTDQTDSIIENAIHENPWIKLIQLPQREYPSFKAVVENTTLGINRITFKNYEYIGLLDSDLEFQTDYFEKLIQEFDNNPKLGLAGGVAIDVGLPKNIFPRNQHDVSGALQFFRRECFDSIGTLIAIPEGGWDYVTCIQSRMHNWDTKLVSSLVVDHLKPRNVSQGGLLRRKWQMGVRDYALGYHPLFELVKCISRLRERPFLIASIAWFLGYCIASLRHRNQVVPTQIINFAKNEQMKRLREAFKIQ